MGYIHSNSLGVTYYLNTRKVLLRGNREYPIYYFSKDRRPETECDLPEGYKVIENRRNSFLTIKKKA
jgi:hypothetical protein